MRHHYYYAIAGLPDIEGDDSSVAFSPPAVYDEIIREIAPSDRPLIMAILAPVDLHNDPLLLFGYLLTYAKVFGKTTYRAHFGTHLLVVTSTEYKNQ